MGLTDQLRGGRSDPSQPGQAHLRPAQLLRGRPRSRRWGAPPERRWREMKEEEGGSHVSNAAHWNVTGIYMLK